MVPTSRQPRLGHRSATSRKPPTATPAVAPSTPSVLSALEAPPVTTIEEVIDRQRALQRQLLRTAPRRGRDGLACFNFLYRIITEDVLARIERGGFFEDPTFVTELDVVFANRYFDALRADVTGGSVPMSWQVLLSARNRRRVAAVRFAVAGVNAHVNYDLPFALLTTVEHLDRPLTHDRHRADYERINDIFAIHMCGLRQHFQSHLERRVDDLVVGRLANSAGHRAVDWARDVAWANAERIWARRHDERFVHHQDRRLDRMTAWLGRALLVPVPT
jgi:hypothetical protein